MALEILILVVVCHSTEVSDRAVSLNATAVIKDFSIKQAKVINALCQARQKKGSLN